MRNQCKEGDLVSAGYASQKLFIVVNVDYGDPKDDENTGFVALAPLFERCREEGTESIFIFCDDPSSVTKRLQRLSKESMSDEVLREMAIVEGAIASRNFEHLNASLSSFID